jgi:alkylation response protein AidB-like acyl-CoA dehydrogenase
VVASKAKPCTLWAATVKEYPVEKYLQDRLIGHIVEGENETNELFMSFDLQPI